MLVHLSFWHFHVSQHLPLSVCFSHEPGASVTSQENPSCLLEVTWTVPAGSACSHMPMQRLGAVCCEIPSTSTYLGSWEEGLSQNKQGIFPRRINVLGRYRYGVAVFIKDITVTVININIRHLWHFPNSSCFWDKHLGSWGHRFWTRMVWFKFCFYHYTMWYWVNCLTSQCLSMTIK